MAAVRHTWMFRIAAIVFLFFGCAWLWRFGLTDYHPEQRIYGLFGGVLALLTGVLLLRPHRVAIGISAMAAALVSVAAAVFAPNTRAGDPVARRHRDRLLCVCGSRGARIVRAPSL